MHKQTRLGYYIQSSAVVLLGAAALVYLVDNNLLPPSGDLLTGVTTFLLAISRMNKVKEENSEIGALRGMLPLVQDPDSIPKIKEYLLSPAEGVKAWTTQKN